MFFRLFVAMTATSLLVAGCGSSSRGLHTTGAQCKTNEAAINLVLKKATKIEIDPAQGDLEEGKYRYVNAHFLYHDTKKDTKIYIVDTYSVKKDKSTTEIACVRGLKPDMKAIDAAISAVSSFEVLPGGKSNFTVREYSVKYKDSKLTKSSKEIDSSSFSLPSKVFNDNGVDHNFYKKGGKNNYELRAKVRNADGVELSISVKYKKVES